jgi:large subunit ribosomal protein L29
MSKLATERDDLRACDDDELDNRLINARKELFNLRFQVATGRLDNVARIQHVRRQVARILTIQRDREIEAAEREAAVEASGADEMIFLAEPEEHVGRKEARRRFRRAAAIEHEAELAAAAPAEDETSEDESDDGADVADDLSDDDTDVADDGNEDAVDGEHGAAGDDDTDADDDAEAEGEGAVETTDAAMTGAVSSAEGDAVADGTDDGDSEEAE